VFVKNEAKSVERRFVRMYFGELLFEYAVKKSDILEE